MIRGSRFAYRASRPAERDARSAKILTIPNLLTLLRLLLIPIFLAASFQAMYTLAFVLFVTAAVTDILDGFIARRFNQRSRLGALLDPAADKMMLVCGYLFYTLEPNLPVRIPAWLTFVIFVRDFLIAMFAYLLYTRVKVTRFPPSWAGKCATVFQAATLAAAIAASGFAPELLWLAELLFRAALLITLFSAGDYIRRAERMLYERLAPQ
ncbi:MAG: CDP-diacylglycerol--glycerol-3-phosphate 3-phosphatidyltransferase [Acidobacteria bacterium]|nr:MAG: CDP-diacylglycerol--glycerol-3-phosphate 3-phosphatidyltransferase [Acidobacteriota bacterium]